MSTEVHPGSHQVGDPLSGPKGCITGRGVSAACRRPKSKICEEDLLLEVGLFSLLIVWQAQKIANSDVSGHCLANHPFGCKLVLQLSSGI